MTESLTAAGVDPQLASAAHDEEWDVPVRAALDEAVGYVGDDVGSPVLVFDTEPRRGISGPVLSPAPTGEAALRLWDQVRGTVEEPGFYELKRGRDAGPQLPPPPAVAHVQGAARSPV